MEVKVYNVLGERIILLYPQSNQWIDSKGEVEVDVSSLPQGVYYIKALVRDKVEVVKFVKQ